MIRLGVDTGGTFTDFMWLDPNGRFRIHKQLSTPHDPADAILSGVAELALPETASVVHGSTVATNALLERRGARTALITTYGFADVLEIGRQNRPDLYALVPQKPLPLVPRTWRFEVNERVTAQGEILTPLNPAQLLPIVAQCRTEAIESVAVCLLFSFLRREHEQQIRQIIQATSPDLHISLSCEILPEYREYERTATTVINAYVAPLMSRYLARLAASLQPRRLTIMQSNGGVMGAATAGAQAARTALSGPAGGVVGARFVAQLAGFSELITFDMGGTSTDVALCPGRLPTTSEGEIAGLPLRLPIIDIHTVGAGGGSLAHVDPGGALHVGPQSAGADPGPACYGRQADATLAQATTTDANLVLGRLDGDHFLGGRMRLDVAAAEAALATLARNMGLTTASQAALRVIRVANANLARAVRRISVKRGFDPRRFTLVAFGGAGPLHACELAADLRIGRILVPTVPGVLSALGMLAAAPTKDYSQTVMRRLDNARPPVMQALQAQVDILSAKARAEMAEEGVAPQRLTLRFGLDMRYVGQSHELTVPFSPGEPPVKVGERFHQQHAARYGYRRDGAPSEIVTLRLTAVAPVHAPALPQAKLGSPDASAALVGEKQVWFGPQPHVTQLYDRDRLRPGNRLKGPAVIFQYDTTTVVPPEWEMAVDGYSNLHLHHTGK